MRKKLLIVVCGICLGTAVVLIAVGHAVRSQLRQRNEVQTADKSRSLRVGEVTRNYLIYIPKSYNEAKTMPLLLVFHGGGSTPQGMSRYTRFDQLADQNGFIVAYPEGTKKQWNDGRMAAPKVDDVAFVRNIIDDIKKIYKVDTKRIYATGMSNGGIFSQRLGCEMSGTLAGIAAVAGTMPSVYSPNCKPGSSLSVLMIHGTDDPLVPFDGGMIRVGSLGIGGEVWSVESTINYWAKQDGCESKPKSSKYHDTDPNDGTQISEDAYTGCRDGTAVLLYTVNGGGHTWPGGIQYLPASFIGKTSRDMDASEVIWDFFSKHPRQ